MKKFSIIFKYIAILTFGFFLLAFAGYSENEIPGFSKELKQVLENKIELLQNIAKDPRIIEKVKISNSNNRDFNLSEILETDKKWQETESLDDFIKFYGEIEYDESALAESIPIYIPVIDPGINKAIGVIKAVCDITAIKMEL
ncbi:MAG: hypothetical protein JRF31_09885 [Deltaproteobacteria bacterium]|nr:hypothetical protein [Deltaproteobacteria bacterium]MBW2321131.1 hypothetical protein [Deltaproteobacteria bacterium]